MGVYAPSAIVFGVAIFTISPFKNDYYASFPASGSTPITLQFLEKF